jgi:histidyl-tRNA synthetase
MDAKKPRGTRDFSYPETEDRQHIQTSISAVFERFGYRQILTPTFEHVELFAQKSGDEITEHMYVFEDKGGRRICLRPEATASVCRMYGEEMRDMRLPLRMYYFCPMFRYERPQKGRYREFWQLGVELLGAKKAEADAEAILLAYESLKEIGLSFDLEVGHVGVLRGFMKDLGIAADVQDKATAAIDKGDRDGLMYLTESDALGKLIDLKGTSDAITTAEKLLTDYPTASAALAELKEILSWLDLLSVPYQVNLGIARGLEYYTGMVFEMRVPALAAQNQICGGGRYDKLIELLSGLSVPAVGFAFGFDRVMNAIEHQNIQIPKKRVDVVVAPVNEEVRKEAFKIAADLRKSLSVDLDVMGRKLPKILEYASETKAKCVLIIGPADLKEKKATIRNMADGKQEAVAINELAGRLKEICS